MAFGFGPLPGAPSGISMEDLVRLFGQAPMGAGQGFSGSSTGPVPATDSLQPPAGPQPVDVPMPPQRPLSFGPPAKPPAAAAQADVPAADAQPIVGQSPLSIVLPAQTPAAVAAAPEGPSLLDKLGAGVSQNSDLLIGLGTGLMSTHGFGNGLSAGFQNAQRASALSSASDLARAELGLKQQKLAREQRGENATAAFLKAKGFDDSLATAAMSNPTVLSSVLSQMNKDPSVVTIGGSKYSLKPGEKPTEANLLGPAEAEKDKATLVDVPQPDGTTVKTWLKPGEVAGQSVGAPERSGNSNVAVVTEERRKVADSLGWKPDTDQYKSFVATGKLPKEDQQSLTVTDKQAILEADEAIQGSKSTIGQLRHALELSKKAYSGPTAAKRGYFMSLFGDEAGIATQELDNQVTAQALENLKATFGGAPTEGERKILLDIQGASSQAPEVRDEIYKRAIAAAERRQKFNEDRANQLRGGTYYKSAPAAGAPAAPAVAAQPALPPSLNQAPPKVATKEDYDRLPSGTPYMAPDGSLRTKP